MTRSNLIFVLIGLVFVGAVIYQSIQREKKKDGDSKCGCTDRSGGGGGDSQALEYGG